jgi:hypothetical protein
MRSQKWYCAFTIWYFLYQTPNYFKPQEMKDKLWDALKYLDLFENEDHHMDTAVLDDPYGCILRWYHSHAVLRICQNLKVEDPDRFSRLDIEPERHKKLSDHWQTMAEKSLRLFGQGRLMKQILRQETANLALVGEEIDIGNNAIIPQGPGLTCLEFVRKLIDSRSATTVLNAGRSNVVRWDAHDQAGC